MEDSAKKGRGRPKILSHQTESYIKETKPTLGRRAIQAVYYRSRCFSLLGKDPAFSWLVEQNSGGKLLRASVLEEIGRFPSDESRIEAAVWCCKNKPKARWGVSLLRRWRTSLEGKQVHLIGYPSKLRTELRNMVNSFIARYPETDWAIVLEAVEGLKDDIQYSINNKENADEITNNNSKYRR